MFERVLRQPGQVSAAVYEPLLDLEHQPKFALASAPGVIHGHLSIACGRHEADVDAAVPWLLHVSGQQPAAHPAVDLCGDGELAQLDDRAVHDPDGRSIGVAFAQPVEFLLCPICSILLDSTQHCIVPAREMGSRLRQ